MRIAIIGAGISGLSAAYLASSTHDITLYEKNDRLGGHAHTLFVEDMGTSIPVDNGFMVFNPRRYPNFCKLLKDLDIESVKTSMSLSASIPGQITYRATFPKGLFLNKNVFRLRYWKFLLGVVKFRNKAKQLLRSKNESIMTLGEFKDAYNISEDTMNWAVVPTLAAVWSIQDTSKVYDFPALATFQFLDNHNILDALHAKWRTIPGGSIRYVQGVEKYLKTQSSEILLSQTITEIKRSKKGITITSNGRTKRYDKLLLATHANIAKKLLSDIDTNESAALSCFAYTKNETVLHSDRTAVPIDERNISSWNYHLWKKGGMFSYCMNSLQHISWSLPLFVTLNSHTKLKKVHHTEQYEHPQYNNSSLKGQRLIKNLQGTNNTYYAGAHLGYGFHEDGITSALAALKAMKVTPKWQKN